MACGARVLLLASGLLALSLGGCNAVLGIDEAHSRDGGGPALAYLEIPIDTCDAPKANLNCGSCAQANCQGAYPACMADHDCRKALNTYRGCLGPKCGDPTCFDAFKAKGPLAGDLAECMEGECSGCLGTSPWADMCDLYCACMVSGCESELVMRSELKWSPGGSECKAACLALKDLPSVHCRFTHCQLFEDGQGTIHCTHAISEANCPLSKKAEQECTDRNLNGWGCSGPSECCSDNCGSDDICAP